MLNSAWLGLVVGLSIRSSGMLPGVWLPGVARPGGKERLPEVRPMFLVAPVVAVGTAAVAFVLANAYDDPLRADDRGPALPRAHGRLGGAQMAPRSGKSV